MFIKKRKKENVMIECFHILHFGIQRRRLLDMDKYLRKLKVGVINLWRIQLTGKEQYITGKIHEEMILHSDIGSIFIVKTDYIQIYMFWDQLHIIKPPKQHIYRELTLSQNCNEWSISDRNWINAVLQVYKKHVFDVIKEDVIIHDGI